MDVLAYNSGFDFADVVKDLDGDYVKLMGTTIDGRYCFDAGGDKMIYVHLPMNDNDCMVRKLAVLGIKKNVVLPKKMNFLGNVTNSNGKMVCYKRTLEDCTIVNRQVDDEFEIVGEQINMEGFFHKSNFIDFDNGLVIKDSSIDVSYMFSNSKGLTEVTFKRCDLSSLVGLTYNSDIECVTFEGCSLVVKDNSNLKPHERRLEATCLDEIFDRRVTTVNLRYCDDSLIEELMKLNSREQQFFRELEINILD